MNVTLFKKVACVHTHLQDTGQGIIIYYYILNRNLYQKLNQEAVADPRSVFKLTRLRLFIILNKWLRHPKGLFQSFFVFQSL